MKHDVLTFIDSDTLREMLRGKELSPAIECILIVQSRKQSLISKLGALTERYQNYSEDDFDKGIYHYGGNLKFYSALKEYIARMSRFMKRTVTDSDDTVFQLSDDFPLYSPVFHTLEEAVSFLRNEKTEIRRMERYRVNDRVERPVTYLFNDSYEVTSVIFYEEYDWWIEEAFAELPHTYQAGDIIRYQDEFYVIANISRADHQTRWLKNADSGDMSLYCFGYYPDKMHPCGGSFGHYHVPLLQAEMARPEDLSEIMKPLTALSLLLKGELKITDFLESYSNGALEDLMHYYGKKAK